MPARASSVVSLLLPTCGPSLPAAAGGSPVRPHPLLHSKLSRGSCFAAGKSLALLTTTSIPWDEPVSLLVSAHLSPTLLPLLLHSQVTGLSRGAPCLPHTFAPAVSSAQHTLPSHVDMASSSTFFRSLFKSHFQPFLIILHVLFKH